MWELNAMSAILCLSLELVINVNNAKIMIYALSVTRLLFTNTNNSIVYNKLRGIYKNKNLENKSINRHRKIVLSWVIF